MKEVAIIASVVIGLGSLTWGVSHFALAHKKEFGVKHENVDRQIYEESQSYVHGKINDLAKYYEEYQKSDDKEAIKSLVKMNFDGFDESKIKNDTLRKFLVKTRGY